MLLFVVVSAPFMITSPPRSAARITTITMAVAKALDKPDLLIFLLSL